MRKFSGYLKFRTKKIHKQACFVYTIEYIQIITAVKVYTLDIFLHNKGYLIYPKDISTKKADIKRIYN